MRWLLLLASLSLLVLPGCFGGRPSASPDAMQSEPRDVMVEGGVALASLTSLSDGHLLHIANQFRLLATTGPIRTAEWERIRGPLSTVEELSIPGLFWFALPDGSYWSVQDGRATGNLSDRPYWPRLMAGQTVIGDLVASRATGKSSAIVAVPVRGPEDAVVGVLGSSLYLDSLSLRIGREMRLEPNHLFYSLDAEPVVGLNSNPRIIFLHPLEEDDPDMTRAIREMLSREEGTVTYRFRGEPRTVLYRRSGVTGWWYAFGYVGD